MTEPTREPLNLIEHPATTITEDEELASVLVAPASPQVTVSLDEVFDYIFEWGGASDE